MDRITDTPSISAPPWQRWLPVIVLLLGVAITLGFWKSVQNSQQNLMIQRVPLWHAELQLTLNSGVEQRLASVQLQAQTLATQQDTALFESLSRELLRQYADIQRISWVTATVPDAGTDSPWMLSLQVSRSADAHPPSQADIRDVPTLLPALKTALSAGIPAASPLLSEPDQPGKVLMKWLIPVGNAPVQALILLELDPRQMLDSILSPHLNPGVITEVFDVEQHRKDPLFSSRERLLSTAQPISTHLDATLQVLDRRWMLRTQPNSSLFSLIPSMLGNLILVLGALLSLLVGGLLWRATRQLEATRGAADAVRLQWEKDRRALQNKSIEKDVLNRALSDSEQRTRDFIELADAVAFELDEEGRIGFVSPQIHTLTERPPSAMNQRPLADLLPPDEQPRLTAALQDCRRSRHTVRLDTLLRKGQHDQIPVGLRVRPIADPINECIGFRVVCWERH
ncbi:MAG: PAS domain-containing protein [Gammaproteobacteria bacterium]|nr:PAS domain-containing protein [Gammaproteobacteria bacterium]